MPFSLLTLRRLWLAASASVLLGSGSVLHASGDAHGAPPAAGGPDEIMTEEKQDLSSPNQAYEWLVAGNERFRTGKTRPKNLVTQRKAVAHGQHPYATIVSCMDSRTSSELLFDANLGDFFNIRIAGNVVNDDVLGSLEYAHKVAGAKLIVVLGHTHCGAVKGAADDVVMGNLTGLVARIRPAVNAIPPDGKPRTSKNLEFIDRVGRMHVILTVRQIRERSSVLRDLQDRGLIDILGAFYDLETGRVEFYRPLSGSGPVRLKTTVIAPEKHSPAPAAEHAAPAEGDNEEGAHGHNAAPSGDAPSHSDEHGKANPPSGHDDPAPSDHAAPAEHAEPSDHATPAPAEHAAPVKPKAEQIVPAHDPDPEPEPAAPVH